MQPSQTRQQRRAAERLARKLAHKAGQPFQAPLVPVPAPRVAQAPVAGPRAKHGFSPELEREFSIESLNRARAIYDHFEVKAAARRSARKEQELHAASSPVLEISATRETIPQVVELAATPHKNNSTGPRTPAGKFASSGNSLKHGLAAPRLIIPGEDPSAFEALLSGLRTEHQPATPTEELLVHEIAQSWWLTQRALRFQNECFTPEGVDEKRLSLFLRYQTTHERAFHKALTTLIRLKKERTREFVSQNRADLPRSNQFVSQTDTSAAASDQFVSQNQASENQFEGSAA